MKKGRLTIIKYLSKKKGEPQKVHCLCTCGKETIVILKNLIYGNTKSCGCLKKEYSDKHRGKKRPEISGKNNKRYRHGMYKTKIYHVWQSMISRCYNEKDSAYKNYGARGIFVSNSWMDFLCFWNDVKDEYREGLTIDRTDNEDGYHPGNFRWVDRKIQTNNSRRNTKITYGGITKNLGQWAKDVGVTSTSLRRRIRNWGLDIAINTKKLGPNQNYLIYQIRKNKSDTN